MLCVMSMVTVIIVGVNLGEHNKCGKNIPWLVKNILPRHGYILPCHKIFCHITKYSAMS